MEMSVRQYYGWLACVIGSSDGEIEMEMADTYRRLGVPATEFRGRLLAIDILEVDACACGGGVRKTLALKLANPAAMQTLSFDLHDRLTQLLLRKLAMIDSNEDLEIRLWILNDHPGSIKDREDERFVSVIQGRYCWDCYIGEPWVPRPGEKLDDLEHNLDYAVRSRTRYTDARSNGTCNLLRNSRTSCGTQRGEGTAVMTRTGSQAGSERTSERLIPHRPTHSASIATKPSVGNCLLLPRPRMRNMACEAIFLPRRMKAARAADAKC